MTSEATVTIETPSDREVVVTRTFGAPRRLVFDAFTRPDLMRRWYGSLELCESDPRAGGSWRCVMKRNNKTVGQYGIYREVSAPDRFVRTERWEDWDPGETLVTTVLTERAGKTTMEMRIVFPSQEVRDVVLKGGLTPKGMGEYYARLDALLAEG